MANLHVEKSSNWVDGVSNSTIAPPTFHPFHDNACINNISSLNCMSCSLQPFLMDFRPATKFRGRWVADGALLDLLQLPFDVVRRALRLHYGFGEQGHTVRVSSRHDAELVKRGIGFFQIGNVDVVKDMMALGRAHGKQLAAHISSIHLI
jgi:hypothetical protein